MGSDRARLATGQLNLRTTALVALWVALLASCNLGSQSVTGVVVEVQGDLTEVTSFTILKQGGERMSFTPDPLGNHAFPLPHLRDHLRDGSPVTVVYSLDRDGVLVARTISDG